MERVEAVAEITKKEFRVLPVEGKAEKLTSSTHELIALRRILMC
jgi:hypothetical protein